MPSSYSRMSLDELRLCAMEGDTEAEYLLGQRLLGQRGRALEGMEHLKNAAKKRHLQACERLGSAYLYGEGDVPQDKKQAMVYYEQALALGSTTARTQLTRLYLESEDRAARGLQLLTEAAEAGDKEAAARAARLYLTGEIAGVDLAKAAKYAALSGDSAVLYETADRLETLGAEPETRDALYRELLKKDREGAQLGIQACLTLARMYEKGRGTRPDGRSAERLLRRAMELEKQQAMAEPRAEMQLAELYEAGAEGLPADHAAARRLLQTVAKGGSEVARLRYIRLCTQDGLYLDAYRASAEAQKYGEALRCVLENWEKIPDKAAFVDRALLFAGPTRREGGEARALRQELYRRALLAGTGADRVLAGALQRGDAAGALAFFQALNDADKSAVYENRELCASLPEGQGPEADQLRALLAEPPEEFRRYAVDLARLRACADPRERWALRQELLPQLPEAREDEARPLAALRQALRSVPEPPKPAPPKPEAPPPAPEEPAEPAAPRKPVSPPGQVAQPGQVVPPEPAAPAEERAAPARKPFVLPSRAQPAEPHTRRMRPAAEDGGLRARVEEAQRAPQGPQRDALLAALDAQWQGLAGLFAAENPADSAAVQRARRFAWEVLEPASPLYEGRRAPAFDAVCDAVLRLIEGADADPDGLAALRARWEETDKASAPALRLAVETLHRLPGKRADEAEDLAAFRAELWESLRAGWAALLARIQDENAPLAERKRQAAAAERELLTPARDLCAGEDCPEYAALCAAADRLLRARPAQAADAKARGGNLAALRAQREKLRRDPIKAMRFAIDALHKLPPPAAGEDRDLAAFRAELREELRARWEIFIPYFDPDSPKGERNPKVLRERARFFAREFLRPAQDLYAQAPCAEYDALCAAVERALPGEAEPEKAAEAAPDWNARLRSLAGRRAEPDAFSALAREYGELPAEAAGEEEALARYRAALVREMRAVLLDLCRGLERCSAPADRKQYAENALRRLDVLSAGSLPVRQEWEEARALLRQAAAHPEDLPWQQRLDQIDRAPEKARKRLLREVEGQLPPAAAGEDPALTELRRRAGAQGWKERLDAFNALTREEDKRAFAQGPKGDLPAEAEGEDVNLTILRLLLEPYRGDLFSQAAPEDDAPEDDSPEDDAPPPEEEDDAPPRRRRKRRGRTAALVLCTLAILAVAAVGGLYLAERSGAFLLPETPQETSAPQDEGSTSVQEGATLMDLSPAESPTHYYLHRWTNPTYEGDFQLLDGEEVRACDGIGWFVPSSALGGEEGAQGQVEARYDLGGQYRTLRMTVSADQEWNDGAASGTFCLTVLVDGQEVYSTGWGDVSSSFAGIEIDLRGAQELTLVLEEVRGSAGTLNIVMGDLTLA